MCDYFRGWGSTLFPGEEGGMGGDSLLVRHPPLRIQAQSQQAGQQDMVMKLTEFFGLSIHSMEIFGLMSLIPITIYACATSLFSDYQMNGLFTNIHVKRKER